MSSRSTNRRPGVLFSAVVLPLLLLAGHAARAYEYVLPPSGESVVGEITMVKAKEGETLLDIARTHKLGYEEIRLANPGTDTWLPGAGTEVVIPKQFVLPDAPRDGIVVNVPEMRLYYYPKVRAGEPARVLTYPVSVGRVDWKTPIGKTEVIRKDKDPAWRPPESIRAEHAARGDFLPKYVAPGPDNPLGQFALRLGLAGYLIHGTNRPYGIGMQVTHGCLRLYPEDIDALFNSVSVGTPVYIVNQAAKAGWRDGRLFVEIHPNFEEAGVAGTTSLTPLVNAVLSATGSPPSDETVDWEAVYAAARLTSGIPEDVSKGGLSSTNGPALGSAD